jgi:hypothetical protein
LIAKSEMNMSAGCEFCFDQSSYARAGSTDAGRTTVTRSPFRTPIATT